MLTLGPRHLRRVLAEYVRHYNNARPHRALGLQPPQPPADNIDLTKHRRIHRKPALGGPTNEYERAT
jgi:transposase InsO family protein